MKQDIRYYLQKKISYSQYGEDLLIKALFENQPPGFYVDIGAHHPFRFSNTYIFYKEKWRGINIDPQPGTKKKFDFFRPKDINLEFGVASTEGVLTYYMFDEPALNGFSKDLSLSRHSTTKDGYHIIGTKDVPILRLDTILDKYLPVKTNIDFLTIDVEGLDLEVLKSNNWEKYRPTLVIVEEFGLNINKLANSVIYKFLTSLNYELVSKTMNSLIFKKSA